MNDKYSANEEDYNHDTAEEAAEDIWNTTKAKKGDIVTVWRGSASKPRASRFLPWIDECIGERAHLLGGEHADGFGLTLDEAVRLQRHMEAAVDAWYDKTNNQPEFYTINKVVEIKMRFTDDDGESEVTGD